MRGSLEEPFEIPAGGTPPLLSSCPSIGFPSASNLLLLASPSNKS